MVALTGRRAASRAQPTRREELPATLRLIATTASYAEAAPSRSPRASAMPARIPSGSTSHHSSSAAWKHSTLRGPPPRPPRAGRVLQRQRADEAVEAQSPGVSDLVEERPELVQDRQGRDVAGPG